MKNASAHTTRVAAGRPRSSNLTRAEQLRVAKRAQRQRDGKAGLLEARIKLPAELTERLLFASRQPGFIDALTLALEAQTVEISLYPQLKLLCWNRRGSYLSAEDAWNLYERNRRFVDPALLEPAEQRLIEMLASRFGGGVLRRGAA